MNRLVDVLTLQDAINAVEKYNSSNYGRKLNIVLDKEGYQLFNVGLGMDLDKIEAQVHFIGKDYGGVAGFPSAVSLSKSIATHIFNDKEYFTKSAVQAMKLIDSPVEIIVLDRLYKAFVQPFHGRSNWHVWATKFLHFLNPNAFPIQDSRVNKCFNLSSMPNSPYKYHELILAIREFLFQHQSWLSTLREIDKGYSWSDLKLIDKVFYTIVENTTCVP